MPVICRVSNLKMAETLDSTDCKGSVWLFRDFDWLELRQMTGVERNEWWSLSLPECHHFTDTPWMQGLGALQR
jgi:hypothetical protein